MIHWYPFPTLFYCNLLLETKIQIVLNVSVTWPHGINAVYKACVFKKSIGLTFGI